MQILVTGGAGFIGSHLCKSLLDEGHHVICVDNLYTGSRENIRHLLDNNRFEFLRMDVREPLDIQCDRIFHLACPASPVHYQKNPIYTIETTVIGTQNLLKLAYQNRARILVASTSEVYGDPLEHPQKEQYWGNVNPVGPRACYDESKRMAETLATEYEKCNGVDVRIIRIFNTYGPHMALDDGRVISNFFSQALRGEDITVYGKGDQTRSFCYIDDMVCGLRRAMNEDGFSGPFNLGNPDEHSIHEIANKIQLLTGGRVDIVYKNLPVDDPKRRQPDIGYAKLFIDWTPTISLDEGLRKTMAYFDLKIYSGRGLEKK